MDEAWVCIFAIIDRGRAAAQVPRSSQPRKKTRQSRRDAVVVANENAEQTYFKESSRPFQDWRLI
ncbi:MAG: hypothetical protein AB9891_10405 [Anaerolineaceae bacterium]